MSVFLLTQVVKKCSVVETPESGLFIGKQIEGKAHWMPSVFGGGKTDIELILYVSSGNEIGGVITDFNAKLYSGSEFCAEINMQNYGSYACVKEGSLSIPGNGTGGPWIHTIQPYCCNYPFSDWIPNNMDVIITIRDQRGNTHTITKNVTFTFTRQN